MWSKLNSQRFYFYHNNVHIYLVYKMVVYTCERCQKQFSQKCVFDKHVNRKIPCQITNEPVIIQKENYCGICNRQFSRSDTLRRHMKSQLHKKIKEAQINNHIRTNNGVINQIIGDKNIIINENYYFLSPFGQEEIDGLTTKEKFAIFLSDDNPIVMIIVKTNLNPLKPQYHNVGYTNLNSGYGLIYNGDTWERKEIESIMNDLLNSKRKDLLKIYTEIKDFLSEADSKNIENKLDTVDKNVEPKLEQHIKSKRKLVMNLKTHLFNNRFLVLNAIRKSQKTVIDSNKKNKNSWSDRYDFDDIEKKIKLNIQKINLKKEMAKDILEKIDEIDDIEYESIIKLIDDTTDINVLNIIIRLLNKTFCFCDDFNSDVLEDKIKNENEINEILFG
ncbi:hypothetical protein QJ857_gp0263 [Tupanvirus soda lake]|uniref:C2H2-type domain-containing protein n=2 Tax=Tupanvirus TaxID=2094720 RepID=A0A6N1P1S5_9VIRU|nr:hypothetical protein QJ857_gp0263 [Tupanvirus soda lake]QKU35762.1 hypothetical protein [Tupanvirus soda lake]